MASPRSLRASIAIWMLPVGVAVFTSSLWMTEANIASMAESAYDRSLAGALRAIEGTITTANGGLGVQLPYSVLATLQATTTSVIYVRVSTEDGLVQIGDIGLPSPPPQAELGRPYFYGAHYLGQNLRAGVLRRQLDSPLYGAGTSQTIRIEVAETTEPRAGFMRRVLGFAFARDLAVSLIGLLLLFLGLHLALRPLSRLKDRFDRRRTDDLSEIPEDGLPVEVRSVVESFNLLLRRYRAQSATQRRFLDDASHQLRTPISILRMQVDYALAAPDDRARDDALRAMLPIIDRSTRMTGQLLALARAESLSAPMDQSINIEAILRDVGRIHLPAARIKGVTFSLDIPDCIPDVVGNETLLYEAFANLLDNAIRHAPRDSLVQMVVKSAASFLEISFIDSGVGASDQLLERIGRRFVSARPGFAASSPGPAEMKGTGLGLAIAKAVAEAHGGGLWACNLAAGGFAITLQIKTAEP